MKIGFIGLGRMGQGMAQRILDSGHDLTIYNRTADKAARLGDAGATVAPSVAALCDGAELVITMLTDDDALSKVALGASGITGALADGAIHMAMGTHGVDSMRTLTAAHADAGQIFVAAPVLGRPDRCWRFWGKAFSRQAMRRNPPPPSRSRIISSSAAPSKPWAKACRWCASSASRPACCTGC
ncbi:MAG: NAD(P)-dependent oxidoreductase [Alphaproteobacteria bacterium]